MKPTQYKTVEFCNFYITNVLDVCKTLGMITLIFNQYICTYQKYGFLDLHNKTRTMNPTFCPCTSKGNGEILGRIEMMVEKHDANHARSLGIV